MNALFTKCNWQFGEPLAITRDHLDSLVVREKNMGNRGERTKIPQIRRFINENTMDPKCSVFFRQATVTKINKPIWLAFPTYRYLNCHGFLTWTLAF